MTFKYSAIKWSRTNNMICLKLMKDVIKTEKSADFVMVRLSKMSKCYDFITDIAKMHNSFCNNKMKQLKCLNRVGILVRNLAKIQVKNLAKIQVKNLAKIQAKQIRPLICVKAFRLLQFTSI